MMRLAPSRFLPLALLGLLVLPMPAAAGEPRPEDEKKPDQATEKAEAPPPSAFQQATGPKERREVKVYTNADLERMFGASPVPAEDAPAAAETPGGATAPGGEPPPDPLAELLGQGEREAERRQQAADAQQRVRELRERVAELERQLLATKNPLLSRRSGADRSEPPDEESAEEWVHLEAGQRVERIEQALEAARQELMQAEAAPGGGAAPR